MSKAPGALILRHSAKLKFEIWPSPWKIQYLFGKETILNKSGQNIWNGTPGGKKQKMRDEELKPLAMTRVRSVASKCYLTRGFKMYVSWQISKKIYLAGSGTFVLTFFNRVILVYRTNTVLFLWLQRPTSCTLLSTQLFLCKKFWRREKSAETSNKSRITGPSNLRLCAKFKFETRLSLWVI